MSWCRASAGSLTLFPHTSWCHCSHRNSVAKAGPAPLRWLVAVARPCKPPHQTSPPMHSQLVRLNVRFYFPTGHGNIACRFVHMPGTLRKGGASGMHSTTSGRPHDKDTYHTRNLPLGHMKDAQPSAHSQKGVASEKHSTTTEGLPKKARTTPCLDGRNGILIQASLLRGTAVKHQFKMPNQNLI